MVEIGSLEEGEQAALAIPQGEAQLIWRGPFGRNSSLSTVNSMMVEALERQGVISELQPVSSNPSELSLPAVSQSWPVDLLPASQGPQLTFAPWEYFYPPLEWVQRGPRRSNRWWTPSAYAKQGMVESCLSPEWIDIIPNGVDLGQFTPQGEVLLERNQQRTVFLFVGGTIFRKGLDLLQQAWEIAFSNEDPAELWIKDFGSDSHYKGQSSLAALRDWALKPGHAPVRVMSDFISPSLMPCLYRSADVGVFPYRGEGFCMPALEAMASGLPVIYPDHGPSREYCEDGGWAVWSRPRRLPAPADLRTWAEPLVHEVDVEALAVALREALDDKERVRRGEAARREAESFSWDKAASKAIESLMGASEEPAVFSFSSLRPQGRKVIFACRPRWGDEDYKPKLQAACSEIAGFQVTLALFLGDASESQALEELSFLDQEALQEVDVTLVEAACFEELALGCDGVVLLGEPAEAMIGRPQLQAFELQGWLEANSGSFPGEMAQ